MPERIVNVWQIGVDDPWPIPELWRLLDAGEADRARSLAAPELVRRYVVAHATRRIVLARRLGVHPAEVRFGARACSACGGPHGKPQLAGRGSGELSFSMAHSHDLCMVAVARGFEVGIDVEYVEPELAEGLVSSVWLAEGELRELRRLRKEERLRRTFETWVGKEAYVKAIGVGLNASLTNILLRPECPDRATVVDRQGRSYGWSVQRLDLVAQYVAAVATEGTAQLSTSRLRASAVDPGQWPRPFRFREGLARTAGP